MDKEINLTTNHMVAKVATTTIQDNMATGQVAYQKPMASENQKMV